ncbi:hypothetical protein T4C_11376 [Trichinella pseudospiralis]|uniref:Uncharacterized protein n=1 Tax=Trichinella pseudospiralis TaxID=6337 RepID=A0A0V1JS80_TRIPS|nr:hypothetical protein T4E_5498 [Trichinella pseudospiralis]KRY84591.1 hypothetical protein T4D_10246 [Trichinella pseudospiralis]KRZ37823.1 hypothetical protein T4C_11376 [Trichinella pseudospiralis]
MHLQAEKGSTLDKRLCLGVMLFLNQQVPVVFDCIYQHMRDKKKPNQQVESVLSTLNQMHLCVVHNK